MQQRVQQGLEDGARLPSLDVERLRGENSALREEQQRLKKVCYGLSIVCFLFKGSSGYLKYFGDSFCMSTPRAAFIHAVTYLNA